MDLFGFDEAEYIQKLRLMPLDELRRKEKSKYHSKVAGGASIAVGAVAATFTGGTALLGSGIGARMMSVSEQKEILVQNELLQRGNHSPRTQSEID
jgi:hypothetical protein